MATKKSKAPFDFSTYSEIMESKESVKREFKKRTDEISSALGEDTIEGLGNNPLTQKVLLKALNAGTIRTSLILFVTRKNATYKNAKDKDKPYVFLFKIVPIWFRDELGYDYLRKREYLLRELNIPIGAFLKLEVYENFRNSVISFSENRLEHLGKLTKESNLSSSNEVDKLLALA